VEHYIITDWGIKHQINISEEKAERMLRFAVMIHEANLKFNITGFKSTEEILKELVLGSIEPVSDIIVPHGTRFADLGSGAGVPGIALGIFFEGITGILIESSTKKVKFIESVIKELNLAGIQVICGRAEEIVADQSYREKFDWCFIRALGKLYIMTELGAPFIKKNGYLYIYSNIKPEDLSGVELKHINKLGLSVMSHNVNSDKITRSGLCLIKKTNTPARYPRNFAFIKREAAAINE
jgi:16S rRNA (guanine527-N7)-methyltransferase